MPQPQGYILGLGDRHPSNLMLDRYSGKLLHIDFGDCSEASMHRDKFPEKVGQGQVDGCPSVLNHDVPSIHPYPRVYTDSSSTTVTLVV